MWTAFGPFEWIIRGDGSRCNKKIIIIIKKRTCQAEIAFDEQYEKENFLLRETSAYTPGKIVRRRTYEP